MFLTFDLDFWKTAPYFLLTTKLFWKYEHCRVDWYMTQPYSIHDDYILEMMSLVTGLVRVFLTFTFAVKILQVTHSCWWRWFTIDVPPSSLNLVLRWLLCYLFCSSFVINTVIVTTGTHWTVMKAGGLAP